MVLTRTLAVFSAVAVSALHCLTAHAQCEAGALFHPSTVRARIPTEQHDLVYVDTTWTPREWPAERGIELEVMFPDITYPAFPPVLSNQLWRTWSLDISSGYQGTPLEDRCEKWEFGVTRPNELTMAGSVRIYYQARTPITSPAGRLQVQLTDRNNEEFRARVASLCAAGCTALAIAAVPGLGAICDAICNDLADPSFTDPTVSGCTSICLEGGMPRRLLNFQ